MRCDNYYPRCGESEETVTHAIFECPPALQALALSSTPPSSSQTFHVSSIYANMNYLFWRKSSIMKPEDNRDRYVLIIWYIWKARNDKLFIGIDRDQLELVMYAESEGQAWYNAKDTILVPPHAHTVEKSQALSLGNICIVDGSWTSTAQFSGIGWVWKDSMGKIQLMGTQNLRRRETALHSKLEALKWAMESMIYDIPWI